jgi:ketosteroid isomerase-like protein
VTAPDLVTEHLAAFNAHDTERLLTGFAADAVWITGQDVVRGRDALAELFDAGLWSMNPHLEVRSIVAADDRAAAQLLESITVDGVVREFEIAVFFTLAEELIVHAKVYREGSAQLA